MLKLISLNIESHRHLDKVIPFLQKNDPDAVCLQEVFKTHLPRFEKIGYHSHFAPMGVFTKDHGGTPALGKWGVAILTKDKSSSQKDYYFKSEKTLAEFAHPGCPKCSKVLLSATLTKNAKKYTFSTTHFTWALPEDADKVQARDLEKLLLILDQKAEFILTGDFNSPKNTQTFKKLNKFYDYHIPQHVKSTIDPKLHRAAPLDLVVDHLFTKGSYQVENVQVQSSVSDHRAIIAEISKN